MKKLAVIGGGAAGLAAAVAAAQTAQAQMEAARAEAAQAQMEAARAEAVQEQAEAAQTAQREVAAPLRVVIYEASDRVGKSILASGNGRCNFSNARLSTPASVPGTPIAGAYHNAPFVAEVFRKLPPAEVLDFFADLGLVWCEEGEGRLFPSTMRANTVLDVLRFALRDLGVDVRTGERVETLDGFDTLDADAVILACGGSSTGFSAPSSSSSSLSPSPSLLPSSEHSLVAAEPVLCPLQTEVEAIKGLDGVRVRAQLSAEGFSECGEVLFRKYGISGIVVYNASRQVRPGTILELDFLPEYEAEELKQRITALVGRFPGRTLAELLSGFLHPRIADAVIRKAGFGRARSMRPQGISDLYDDRAIEGLVAALKGFTLEVKGKEVRRAQVIRGGFAAEAFDPDTLQSRFVPGFYVVGEALDVDGPCGGYNLHWAWASGILAGRSAAKACCDG